jgi:hypothetical protein
LKKARSRRIDRRTFSVGVGMVFLLDSAATGVLGNQRIKLFSITIGWWNNILQEYGNWNTKHI